MSNILRSKELKPKRTGVREASIGDIERLVDIDIQCFDDIYSEHPPDTESVEDMLTKRLKNAGELMIVGSVNDEIQGFMTCQIIDNDPSQITSWETTTNNGTLEGVDTQNGKYFYVVNMTVTKDGSNNNIGSMLVANMCARLIEAGAEKAFLLSRLPGFKSWVTSLGLDPSELDEQTVDSLATQYSNLTIENGQNKAPYDPMLRRYSEYGTRPVRLVKNGYEDPASLNYSMLCEFINPMGKYRSNRVIRTLASKALKRASQHPEIITKIFD